MVALLILKNTDLVQFKSSEFKETKRKNIIYKYTQDTQHENCYKLENELTVGNYNIFNSKTFDNPEKIKGEFSFGKYNFSTNTFVGCRDRIGVKTFFYANTKDVFVYSTSLKGVKESIRKVSVNQGYLERVLTGTAPLPSETFFNEIKRLPPAHELVYSNKTLNIRKYWEPKSDKYATQEEFNRLLIQAVKSRDNNISGSELSGGIDSSGISGILARENSSLQSFRHVMNDSYIDKYLPFGDERKFSQLQVDYSKNILMNDEDSLGKGIVDELINEMKILGSPFYSTMSLFSDSIYDSAKNKEIETLFSGFGGDELVSSTSSYYKRELLNQKKWKELRIITEVDFFSAQNLKYYFRSYFPHYRRNKHWREEQLENHLLNKKVDLDKILKADIATKKYDTLNDLLVSKISGHTLLTRIEENGLSLRARGIEYTYPLFDVDLIQCFLGLPPNVKYNNKLPRSVYRKAIKPYVPKEIYLRNSKTGATVPTVFYRFMNDYDRIMELLNKYKSGRASEFLNTSKMIIQLDLIRGKAIGDVVNKRIDIRLFIIGLQMILYFDMDVLSDKSK